MPATECETPTETHSIAVVSTFHATPECMQYLEDYAHENSGAIPFGIWSGVFGCIIAIAGVPEGYRLDCLSEHERQLCHVAHWAIANNYSYVMLDRDADVVPALPAYRDAWEN